MQGGAKIVSNIHDFNVSPPSTCMVFQNLNQQLAQGSQNLFIFCKKKRNFEKIQILDSGTIFVYFFQKNQQDVCTIY